MTREEVFYPSSDGKPMANSTTQAREMMRTHGGLSALFRNDPHVFVAADLLWYPIEGDNKTSVAPDVMVALGRPKGDRRSYLQWKEDNIPPQVVFEFLSHANTEREMIEKFHFYERHGVQEYYVNDPERRTLEGWIRQGDKLVPIEQMEGWVSPLLGVRFGQENGELVLSYPDGRRFDTYEEIDAQLQQERERVEQERKRVEQERKRVEQERKRVEQERERAEKLARRLRELGIDPDEVE